MPPQHGHVMRRRQMTLGGQAVGVLEGRMGHPQLPRGRGHPQPPLFRRPGQRIANRRRRIIGRLHRRRPDQIAQRNLLPGLQPQPRRRLIGGVLRHRDHGVQRQVPGLDFLKRDVQRHHLGQRRWRQRRIRVLGIQRLPGPRVHQIDRVGCRRRGEAQQDVGAQAKDQRQQEIADVLPQKWYHLACLVSASRPCLPGALICLMKA